MNNKLFYALVINMVAAYFNSNAAGLAAKTALEGGSRHIVELARVVAASSKTIGDAVRTATSSKPSSNPSKEVPTSSPSAQKDTSQESDRASQADKSSSNSGDTGSIPIPEPERPRLSDGSMEELLPESLPSSSSTTTRSTNTVSESSATSSSASSRDKEVHAWEIKEEQEAAQKYADNDDPLTKGLNIGLDAITDAIVNSSTVQRLFGIKNLFTKSSVPHVGGIRRFGSDYNPSTLSDLSQSTLNLALPTPPVALLPTADPVMFPRPSFVPRRPSQGLSQAGQELRQNVEERASFVARSHFEQRIAQQSLLEPSFFTYNRSGQTIARTHGNPRPQFVARPAEITTRTVPAILPAQTSGGALMHLQSSQPMRSLQIVRPEAARALESTRTSQPRETISQQIITNQAPAHLAETTSIELGRVEPFVINFTQTTTLEHQALNVVFADILRTMQQQQATMAAEQIVALREIFTHNHLLGLERTAENELRLVTQDMRTGNFSALMIDASQLPGTSQRALESIAEMRLGLTQNANPIATELATTEMQTTAELTATRSPNGHLPFGMAEVPHNQPVPASTAEITPESLLQNVVRAAGRQPLTLARIAEQLDTARRAAVANIGQAQARIGNATHLLAELQPRTALTSRLRPTQGSAQAPRQQQGVLAETGRARTDVVRNPAAAEAEAAKRPTENQPNPRIEAEQQPRERLREEARAEAEGQARPEARANAEAERPRQEQNAGNQAEARVDRDTTAENQGIRGSRPQRTIGQRRTQARINNPRISRAIPQRTGQRIAQLHIARTRNIAPRGVTGTRPFLHHAPSPEHFQIIQNTSAPAPIPPARPGLLPLPVGIIAGNAAAGVRNPVIPEIPAVPEIPAAGEAERRREEENRRNAAEEAERRREEENRRNAENRATTTNQGANTSIRPDYLSPYSGTGYPYVQPTTQKAQPQAAYEPQVLRTPQQTQPRSTTAQNTSTPCIAPSNIKEMSLNRGTDNHVVVVNGRFMYAHNQTNTPSAKEQTSLPKTVEHDAPHIISGYGFC